MFMSPAYLSLKWVEFKKIFVHAPSRIKMLAIKQKNIIQSTIVCTYFCKLLFLLYLYSLFWRFDNDNENWLSCSIFKQK